MKLVVFVTGLCHRRCFYCPLSRDRRWKDVRYVNERPITSDMDVLKEAEDMDAGGAGFTGGDPLLRPERTLHYLKLLKENFRNFHIHLYTAPGRHLNNNILKGLAKAELDELRLHPDLSNIHLVTESVKEAKREGLTVGVEVPALPGEAEYLKTLAITVEEAGADFIIVNELEMNDENAFQLRTRGLRLKQGSLSAVEGSEEVALDLLLFIESELSLSAHYCPAMVKDSHQYKGRLRRMALKKARPYEEVTGDGLLRKGVIVGDVDRLCKLAGWIMSQLGVPDYMLFLNKERGELELAVTVMREAKQRGTLRKLKAYIVEEYPTFNRKRALQDPI
ncbi:MAG: radical SAM protein [Candidatus Nezhaarchaeota archaeon]|nr:radical SAM protein [Candidatus Nezhaarchaeota archaeon]